MSAFNNLKFVSAKRPGNMPSIQIRRLKLSNKIYEQIQLATALQKGETYAPMRFRSVKDRHTGEIRSVEMPKRIRPLWFTSESGKVCLQLKYGSKTLEFAKGKNAIEVSNPEELLNALSALKSAVEEGALDAQLTVAADSVKEKFKK